MKTVFTMDGRAYRVLIPEGGLKRSASILDGSGAGRLMSGRMVRDLIGTYYNYSLTIETKNLGVAEYDALYQEVTAPVDCHTITMPYGQGTLTFEAYISNVEDVILRMDDARNLWGNLTLNFVAMEPQRAP